MRDILPQILATFTGPRYQVVPGRDFEWSGKSWTHNFFRTYELIFGRRWGIRAESATWEDCGVVHHESYTWEASVAHAETRIRDMLAWRPAYRLVPAPVLMTTNGPLAASPFAFAIAFDATAQDDSTGTVTATWAHTCTGSNLVLSVSDHHGGGGNDTTGVTYNSVSTTLAKKDTNAGGNDMVLSGWYLASPATGSNNVAATYGSSANHHGCAISFSGANTASALGATAQNINQAATGSYSISITTANANSMICDVAEMGGSGETFTATGTGQTRRAFNTTNRSGGSSSTTTTTAGAYTVSYTTVGSGGVDEIAWEIKELAASGPATVKTWDGVTQSTGIKTYEGLALASVKKVIGVA